jgi:hypothetical protein
LQKIQDSSLDTAQFQHLLLANLHQMRIGSDLSLNLKLDTFSTLVAKVMNPHNISKISSSLEIERVASQVVEDRRSFQISITPKVGNLVDQLLPTILAHSVEDIID